MGEALAGREKMIIDAEKVPGRRQLFLADPEQFRVPVPVLVPSERFRRAEPGEGTEN
jgi:hypothetical protein